MIGTTMKIVGQFFRVLLFLEIEDFKGVCGVLLKVKFSDFHFSQNSSKNYIMKNAQ